MTVSYLKFLIDSLTIQKKKIRHKCLKIFISVKSRLNILYKCLTHKDYRVWLFRRLTDINWYKE